jgi:hypothetical protein
VGQRCCKACSSRAGREGKRNGGKLQHCKMVLDKQRMLRSVTVTRPPKPQRDGKPARAAGRCHVIIAESSTPSPGPRPPTGRQSPAVTRGAD